MIEIDEVSMQYGNRLVVNDVSLNIPGAGITVLVGPNGAGKSTLLALISRLLEPTAGRIALDGMNVHTANPRALAKHMAVLRQDNSVQVRISVRELVAFGRFPHSAGQLTQADHAAIDQSLAYLGLGQLADRMLDQLSGGERQRAFIALVLCQDTPYVLLDEPLNGLDMKQSAAMMKVLRQASDELGKTMVLVLHDINFASCYADYMIAMRKGRVVHHGGPASIIDSQLLTELYDTPIRVIETDGMKLCMYYHGI